MKYIALATALLLAGSAAFAQTGAAAYDGDGVASQPYETDGTAAADTGMAMAGETDTTLASNMPAASNPVVEPSNADPERDARGIRVISAAATVPAGWNGLASGAAMGGPLLDPVTGEAIAPASYRACTASVTDHCLQTYERGRH
jgi:hypothetical protein